MGAFQFSKLASILQDMILEVFVVVGVAEYHFGHSIDHLTNSRPISATWLFRKATWPQKHANLSHEGNLITLPYAKDEGVRCGDGERL